MDFDLDDPLTAFATYWALDHLTREEGGSDGEYIAIGDDSVTPLMLAAAEGSVRKVKRLIARGANVNARNRQGATALMYAILSGSVEVARILIENGADVDARDCNGKTALMQAVDRGNIDIVKLLLENGADTDIKDKKGCTALNFASRNMGIEESGGKTVSYPVDEEIIDLLEKAQQEKDKKKKNDG